MNVLISGGGIAGLSAGILLSREGFKVKGFHNNIHLISGVPKMEISASFILVP